MSLTHRKECILCHFNSTNTSSADTYTLSLHDALPIYSGWELRRPSEAPGGKDVARVGEIDYDHPALADRKSTRLNSSHPSISYAVFCLKNKMIMQPTREKNAEHFSKHRHSTWVTNRII